MKTFDDWLEVHKQHKHWSDTKEQLARWAWAEQQLTIDKHEQWIRTVASSLNIEQGNITQLKSQILEYLDENPR